jgi:hypothetical protein
VKDVELAIVVLGRGANAHPGVRGGWSGRGGYFPCSEAK